MQLVLARSEIDRRKFLGGDFTVHRYGERGKDKWAPVFSFHWE